MNFPDIGKWKTIEPEQARDLAYSKPKEHWGKELQQTMLLQEALDDQSLTPPGEKT